MSTLKKIFRGRERTATGDDVRAIAGQMDDAVVAEILRTGAAYNEVLQAFQWLEEDYYTKAIFARPMDERIRRVYDILDYARGAVSWKSRKQ